MRASEQRSVSDHAGEPTIAAFELINEPNGGAWGCEFLYAALRDVDPFRLFLIWNHPVGSMSKCTARAMYGPHLYPAASPDSARVQREIDDEVHRMANFMSEAKVPYFVGELHVNTHAAGAEAQARKCLAHMLGALNAQSVGWAKWSWKGVDVGDWACVNLGQYARVDASHDPLEQIREVWAGLGSGVRNEAMCRVLRDALAPTG